MYAVVLNTWGKGFPQVMHTPTPLWITLLPVDKYLKKRQGLTLLLAP
jgi:hypothetical protein